MQHHLHKARWKNLLLGLSLVLPAWAQAQTEAPSPALALELGHAQLGATLEWLDPAHLDAFGFSPDDDFSAVSLGKPLYRNVFTDESLVRGDEPALQTDMVMLPLMLQGTARCFLYLAPGDDGRDWTVAGIGGTNEARRWNQLFTAKEAGDHVEMIHFVQNNADYLLRDNNAEGLYEEVSLLPAGATPGTSSRLESLYRQAVDIARQARAATQEGAGG